MNSGFFFIKYSRHVIATILCLAVLGFSSLLKIKFDFEIEKYFPAGDENLTYYEDFNKKFNASKRNEYIFIAVKNINGIFQKDFLEKVGTFTNYLKEQKNILEVFSITNLTTIAIIDGTIYHDSLVHISRPELYTEDSINLFKSEEFNSLHLSKNGNFLLISAFTEKGLSSDEKEILINRINLKIDTLKFDEVHRAAKIIVEKTYVDEIEKNFIIYIIAALLIIALTLFLIFRSIIDIVVPFVSIIISVLLTLALVTFSGYTLDSISSLLPSILAIICMSNVIHISVKYKEELANGFSKETALVRTFKEIALATFFSSFTTAIGFFTLCITSVVPIKLFGLFTGLGILIAYVITVAFIFSVYALTPVPANILKKNTGHWEKLVSWIFRKNLSKRYYTFTCAAILILVSIFYISKIEINSSLLINIPKENSLLKEYKFFETQFAGTRIFEMGLSINDPNKNFADISTMREIERVEKFLKDSCGVGLVISPVIFFKTANKILSRGLRSQFALPSSQQNFNTCVHYIKDSEWGAEMFTYLTPDGKQARISGKLPDLTIKEFNALSQKIDQFFLNQASPFSFKYRNTGSGVLLDQVTFLLFDNLIYGLLIGIFIMGLIVGIMFRSVKMGLLMLIPNIIPIMVMGALMGFFNIYLKADTSIIFTIAFGIAVDDTIHLLNKFYSEKKKGLSTLYAMKRSFLTRGKAMILSTVVLSAGFLTLLFSSFQGTFNVGLLITISMIFALVFDLTVTPLIVMLFFKNEKN